MRLTRWVSLALVAALALAVAGIAVAHKSGGKATKTEPAAATFTATPNADKTKTRQCTGEDGTYNVTHGVYEGTSTGDPRLTGNITIKAKSVVNLDNGLGHTEGKVYLRDADTGKLKAVAGLAAVNTERGVLNGYLGGQVKTPKTPSTAKSNGHSHRGGTKLAANFSAAFNAEGTQLSGELGGGPAQNTAVFYGQPCKPAERQPSAQSDDDRRHDGRHGDRDDDDGKHGSRGGDDR